MKKVLVVSDVELLNQLYITNLAVYLNVDVILCEKIVDISKIISESEFELIITLSTIEKEDAITSIIDFKIPTIVIGENEKYKNQIQNVKGYYDLKNIIRESAKILKITPQMMMEEKVGDYYPFKLESLKYLKLAPVNIYLEKQKAFLEQQAFVADKKAIIFDMMIDIAEKEYKIDIRKNSSPEQSTNLKNKNNKQ
jgi:hypothetical protein